MEIELIVDLPINPIYSAYQGKIYHVHRIMDKLSGIEYLVRDEFGRSFPVLPEQCKLVPEICTLIQNSERT